MKVLRISRCKELVTHWPFFAEALTFISEYLRYPYTFETYRRVLQKLVTTPTAFVAVVFDDENRPISFLAAYDATPLYGTDKEYDVPFFYHQPNQLAATALLRREFEFFLRSLKVKRYFITTTAGNSFARRCFARHGLLQSHTVYKREIRYTSKP